jgi:hypothetical protein
LLVEDSSSSKVSSFENSFRVEDSGSMIHGLRFENECLEISWFTVYDSAPTNHDSLLAVKVQGSGFRVQGSGFRVQGSGFRVQGSGFRVQGSGFRV